MGSMQSDERFKRISETAPGQSKSVTRSKCPCLQPYGDDDDEGLEIKRCRKVHPNCHHRCNGVANEQICLPCLDPACIPIASILSGNDEACSICYTCELVDQPCIRLACGHVFHADCVLNLLKHRWSTIRITFAFLDCPSCKRPIELAENATGCDLIKKELEEMRQLKRTIETEALEEAKKQGLDKDPRLTTKGDHYFENLKDFAMHACAFYECYECKGHYFGGMIDCLAEHEMEDNTDKKDLRCKACILKARRDENKQCKAHGTAHIDFKCNFCCSVAVWYCHGTTYYCDKHHSAYPCVVVEECKGPNCPLGIEHPPNIEDLSVSTFPLGCGLCRSIKDCQP